MATPVLILHSNSDGSWVYVRAAISSGWVKADDVGETTREEFETFLTAPFVVTSAALTDIFADKKLTEKLGTLRMGVRLPLVLSDADVTSVLLPIKKEDGSLKINPVFVGNDFIHEGFLAYTPRNVLSQAFKLFGRPYGWGGKELTQDCSRFIQEVFATFGFELPRDSKNQIRTGLQLAQWDEAVTDETKQAFFKNAATPGATLLGMKGHIMLYLGSIDGRAYAIHSVWAYRQSTPDGDQPVVLNRVTLSDLTLGEGSEKGSWLNRINAVRFIGASE